jgi:hypothetical protein
VTIMHEVVKGLLLFAAMVWLLCLGLLIGG